MALSDYETTHSGRPGSYGFRISLKSLVQMCRNVGTGLRSGVDIRQIWETESRRGGTRHRNKMLEIRDRVAEGEGVTDAIRAAGPYFPVLLREMVDVGERTGRLDRVFARLAQHYDNLLRMRRAFVIGIAWPMIELTMAIFVIGLFIWVLGMIGGTGPPPITFFGLYGTSGLLIYASVVGVIVAIAAATLLGVSNGWISLDPLLRVLMVVPGLGQGLKTVAMSRLTWSLAMTTDSDLEVHRAVSLSVRTTQNSYYTSRLDRIQEIIARGGEIHEAFAAAGVFPDEFLGALHAGEVGGQISESMEVLAQEYEERTKVFYRAVAAAAGVAVFLLVAALIIFLIFTLFSQYLAILNDASQI